MTEGYKSEAEGYAASLRQQAKWVRECKLDGTIDADELDAAADFVVRQAASHGSAGGEQPRDLNFFGENVDCWGALEWFNRLAKAIREQDVAVCANDDIVMEVCRNVASSSAMRLVRDYEKQVRDALSRPSTGVEADTSLQNPQTSPAEVVKQHLAWLFQYVQGMNAGNWHDMKMRAERQLEQLSLMLKEPGDSAQASPDLWAAVRQRDSNINAFFAALKTEEDGLRDVEGLRMGDVATAFTRLRKKLRVPTGAPRPRGEPTKTDATQPGGSPNIRAAVIEECAKAVEAYGGAADGSRNDKRRMGIAAAVRALAIPSAKKPYDAAFHENVLDQLAASSVPSAHREAGK